MVTEEEYKAAKARLAQTEAYFDRLGVTKGPDGKYDVNSAKRRAAIRGGIDAARGAAPLVGKQFLQRLFRIFLGAWRRV